MSMEHSNHGEQPVVPRAAEQMVGNFATSLARRSTPNPLARHKYDKDDEYHTDWRDQGECLKVDPGIFFPEKGQSTKEAKRVCGTCDVIQQCGEYALAYDEPFGVWGGLTERDRRRLKSQRARKLL